MAIAHGQMDEGSLETVVLDFWERRYDVLVCTTIIESGIDMPSVNTLIVDRADMLGLGQLHQIRGRVGRGGQRAYAYLFHPADRILSEQAYERLRTIGEHTELGSGFKIAMRDLEIRGAGNLLGSDQSGHIAAVGYDLYVQLVAEAVAEARGEARPAPPTVSVDVPGDAHLPKDYVAAEDARLEAYRRLAAATTAADVDDIGVEWLDRYGPLPAGGRGAPGRGPAAGGRHGPGHRRSGRELGAARRDAAPGRAPGPGVPAGQRAGAACVASRRDATYREDLGQLLVPVPEGQPAAAAVLGILDDLVPLPDSGAEAAHPVRCAAREAVPRPPRPAGRRPGRGRARHPDERGRGERLLRQPAAAELGRARHRGQPRLPVLPQLAGVPVVGGQRRARPGDRRRAPGRTQATSRPPPPPSSPPTSRPRSATSWWTSWRPSGA